MLEKQIQDVLTQRFDLGGSMKRLPGYENPNFLLDSLGRKFVVKVTSETQKELDMQARVLDHLAGFELGQKSVPEIVRTVDGQDHVDLGSDVLRVLTFVEGQIFARVRPFSRELLDDLGRFLGRLDRGLERLQLPERDLDWDLKNYPRLHQYLDELTDGNKKRLAASSLQKIDDTQDIRLGLREQVIHNDPNDYNLVVRDSRTLAGIIDFGDVVDSWRISELAIACSYAMMHDSKPLRVAADIIGGYHSANALDELEIRCLFPLIRARWCMSGVMANHYSKLDPDNEYISVSAPGAWEMLELFDPMPDEFAEYVFRSCCGYDPVSQASRIRQWLTNSNPAQISSVISGKSVVVDISPESPLAQMYDGSEDFEKDSRHLRDSMLAHQASWGIGRYLEPRICYSGPQYVGPYGVRSIHLGVDVFAKAGTEVCSPLDGVVYGFADNSGRLDYGPTIVVQHSAGQDGPVFYTLYGHLSRSSLGQIGVGDAVKAGDTLGSIGNADENGGWPPHLHFQVITDMMGETSQFLGVGSQEHLSVWEDLCLSPAAFFGEHSVAYEHGDPSELLEARASILSTSQSISYREPLHIVRGIGTKLMDSAGRVYLDCVNNVCHVGHCHPAVVNAAGGQQAILNTNTRYLHDNIIRLGRQLLNTLPGELEVCFFVNSGSEANDLAYRIAQAKSSSKEMLVVDGAYHGHTKSLIELSPYKYKGHGGSGKANHVFELPLPDPIRPYTPLEDALDQFANELGGKRIAGFICESLLSCGGQVVLPPGYLQHVYSFVRDRGGVCIADEVQVGLGRVGSHFWGFETQCVVPDIVTVGKPFGNGHPLAAVVTTRAAADAFANGMEYFNTFGGNPVSCAIGSAVLDVIEREELQANARQTGGFLQQKLVSLADAYDCIADVRGSGLFLGIEFVKPDGSLQPDEDIATRVVEACKDRGVLLSTDGPFANVIKIKPPLVFSEDDALLLVHTLQKVLDFVS